MAFDITKIQHGRVDLPPRIILLGTEKIGKSTFAGEFPSPVFLPIKGETGLDDIEAPKFPTVENWDQLLEALGSLCEEDHEYKTVVIDSASTLEPLIVDEAMKMEGVTNEAKLGGGYGRQDDTPLQLWRKLMDCLDYLRSEKKVGSILIGHVMVRPFNDPMTESYDTYEWDIRQKARNALFRWSDVILFASKKILARKNEDGRARGKEVNERVLFTRKSPSHPGGGRGIYGHLPEELELEYTAYHSAVQTTIKNRKETDHA